MFFGINMKCASCHDSFIDRWKLDDAYGLAAVIAEKPLEIARCDKPTGKIGDAEVSSGPSWGRSTPTQPRAKRLERLAELVTHPDNGRFPRTIVNRIWQRLMGRGIVHPVDVMANEPWSEDLLDYLATYLVDHGYDLKALIEHIVGSRAYQSSPAVVSEGDAARRLRLPRPDGEADDGRAVPRRRLVDHRHRARPRPTRRSSRRARRPRPSTGSSARRWSSPTR